MRRLWLKQSLPLAGGNSVWRRLLLLGAIQDTPVSKVVQAVNGGGGCFHPGWHPSRRHWVDREWREPVLQRRFAVLTGTHLYHRSSWPHNASTSRALNPQSSATPPPCTSDRLSSTTNGPSILPTSSSSGSRCHSSLHRTSSLNLGTPGEVIGD